jgi:hypothetical protein
LDALAGDGDATGEPVSLRVYETEEGTPRAFYDVDEAEGVVRQVSSAAAHLEPLASALEVAVSRAEEDKRDCELRLYRIPALNFEAMWLAYEGGEQDVLVPLSAVGPLPQGEAVPFGEAVRVLREAARPLLDMGDTMGA